MKPGLIFTVLRYFLMATQAKRILGRFVKSAMAGVTLLLLVGMYLTHGARHKNQRFEIVHTSRR